MYIVCLPTREGKYITGVEREGGWEGAGNQHGRLFVVG